MLDNNERVERLIAAPNTTVYHTVTIDDECIKVYKYKYIPNSLSDIEIMLRIKIYRYGTVCTCIAWPWAGLGWWPDGRWPLAGWGRPPARGPAGSPPWGAASFGGGSPASCGGAEHRC